MARPQALRRRARQEKLDHEIHAEVARMIQQARHEARLTQAELGERIGTQQQAIARLEDPSYDGHSVRVLNRIAHALGTRLTISFAVDGELE